MVCAAVALLRAPGWAVAWPAGSVLLTALVMVPLALTLLALAGVVTAGVMVFFLVKAREQSV